MGQYCALSCILFYSVHIYEHINDTKKDLISKAVLLTSCKHGQKFQLSCVYHDFLKPNTQVPGSYPHLYKMLCLISVFTTVHHWSPFRAKEMHITYSKTTSSKYISILSFH